MGSLPVGTANYPIPANAIFVAENGNDGAAGTQAAPLATLDKAIGICPAGGTIVMRAGIYSHGTDTQGQHVTYGSFITKSGVTIQNYPGEEVWLDGSVSATGWTGSGGFWSAPYDRCFDRSPTNARGKPDGNNRGWTYVSPSFPCAPWPDQVLYDGNQLTQVPDKSLLVPGTFYVEGTDLGSFWFQGSRVWLADNPSGHQVRWAAKTRIAQVSGSARTIRGIGMRRYADSQPDFGIIYYSSTATGAALENVWIEDVSTKAIWLARAEKSNWTKVTMRHIGAKPFSCQGANGTVMDRCDIQFFNEDRFNASPDSGGWKMTQMQGATVSKCIIANGLHAPAIWTDGTCDNVVVVNSLLQQDADDGAVIFELSSNCILANCKIVSPGNRALFNNSSDKTRVWNNTIVNSRSNPVLHFAQSGRRPWIAADSYGIDPTLPSTYYDDPSHQWQINQWEYRNNVIARTSSPVYMFDSAITTTVVTRLCRSPA